MYIYLSKVLPLFVMPLGVTLILLLVALLLIRKRKRRYAGGVVLAAFAYLWVMSTPIVGENLYRRIEANYPPIPLSEVPQAGCIVVLGGLVEDAEPPRVDVDFSDAVDRIFKTAELYGAGKAPYVVVTGGQKPWSTSRRSEAELIRDQLAAWGVPEEVILLEGSSRNTRENALYTKNLLDSIHCSDVLLVTSSAHMPRSMAAFRAVGVTALPVSTDLRAAKTESITLISFLPDARALEMSSDALRELVGQWVYEMKGWN